MASLPNGFVGELASFKNAGHRKKTFEHSLQINDFSLELVLRCALRLSDTEKTLDQSLQMNGFSPNVFIKMA